MVEWPPIGKMAAHSTYNMFSLYKYLIVNNKFFPPWVLEWDFFLIAPFPFTFTLSQMLNRKMTLIQRYALMMTGHLISLFIFQL